MTDAELIKAAAERVMGWKVRDGYTGPGTKGMLDLYRPGLSLEHYWPGCDGGGGPGNGWNPLASEGDCWQLVEAITSKGELWFKLRSPWADSPVWHAGLTEQGFTGWNGQMDFWAGDPDRRRAIVLAALKACGVEV